MHWIKNFIVHFVWSERIKDWLDERRVLRKWAPLLAATGLTCLFILTGKPHISVPGDRFVFELPPFKRCIVTFVTPVHIGSYIISHRSLDMPPASDLSGVRKTVDAEIGTLTIDNQGATPNSSPSNAVYMVTVDGIQALSVEIASVSVDGNILKLWNFTKNNMRGFGEYGRFRFIRKTLADWVYLVNDPVSNWLLTLMCFWCLFLFFQVVCIAIAAHRGDKALKKYLAKSWGIHELGDEAMRGDNADKCNAKWYSLHRSFHFLQALGPAVGFILTVSSLVGALHPALRSSNNLDAFMTGIHVAMISTFIGLLLRIIALWGERFNNELYERALSLLPPESKPKPEGDFSI